MLFNMSPADYEAIYARVYFGIPPKELINLAGNIKNKVILDLCCGSGRLTNLVPPEAKMTYAVDESTSLLEGLNKTLPNLTIYNTDVSTALEDMHNKGLKIDTVFCQQAVNYWMDEASIKKISKVMNPDTFFIFNTFNKKPSFVPTVYDYTVDTKSHIEVTWAINDTIHHVMCCEGYPPHVVEYAWISPYKFRTLLEPYFVVTEVSKGRNSIYCCRRKD